MGERRRKRHSELQKATAAIVEVLDRCANALNVRINDTRVTSPSIPRCDSKFTGLPRALVEPVRMHNPDYAKIEFRGDFP